MISVCPSIYLYILNIIFKTYVQFVVSVGGCQGLCTWEIVLIVIGVIALLVCIGGVTYFAISKLKKPRPATTVK